MQYNNKGKEKGIDKIFKILRIFKRLVYGQIIT